MQKAKSLQKNSWQSCLYFRGKTPIQASTGTNKREQLKRFCFPSLPSRLSNRVVSFLWQPFSSCPSIFTMIIRWSNSGGHSPYWPGPKSGVVFQWAGGRGTLWPKTPNSTKTGREGEKWNTKRERKHVLHHGGKHTRQGISTHVSFHKFLSREGKLLGNGPWNLSAQLIITITCSAVKASVKIKTSTHSANHHLCPAFHVLFQPSVSLRCPVALYRSHWGAKRQSSSTLANSPRLVWATRKAGRPASCQKRSTPETEPASGLRCPTAATWCAEPSNYTNLQGAVVITQNPGDVQTASAGGLVLTNNTNQNGGWGLVIIVNALTVTADPIIHS